MFLKGIFVVPVENRFLGFGVELMIGDTFDSRLLLNFLLDVEIILCQFVNTFLLYFFGRFGFFILISVFKVELFIYFYLSLIFFTTFPWRSL